MRSIGIEKDDGILDSWYLDLLQFFEPIELFRPIRGVWLIGCIRIASCRQKLCVDCTDGFDALEVACNRRSLIVDVEEW